MDSETLKLLSSIIGVVGGIIGVVGGILGFFTFIDNNVLGFKPQLNISGRLFFSFEEKETAQGLRGKPLKSIIFQIEVINGRNKIGRIDDFAIRIYNQSTTQPKTFILYAENILDRLPSKPTFFDKEKFNLFSPLSILGRSTKNTVVEFTPERYRSVYVPTDGYLKMELLYALPNKKWKVAGTYTPHHFVTHNKSDELQGVMEYSLLDNAVERDKVEKVFKQPESGLYKGISGKYIGIYLRKPIYFIKKVIKYPFKIINLFVTLIILSAKHIIFTKLILPLINRKSKSLPRLTFSNPRAHLKNDTIKTLNRLKEKSQEIIDKINKQANDEAKIILTTINEGFSIQRGKLTIKFYYSGDGHITVQDTDGYPQRFLFTMKIYEYPFGIKLWKVNNKIMTTDSACVLFMDSFILLSH